ncbi:MAG: MATE family efflux transporter [Clostridia bacterium]|nr:MATE family efflux transporter [Clostridia bacterium]
MKIQLSDHFSYNKLLIFTFPSVVMMIFTSVYSVVDGLFISNYVGVTPFAAVNLIIPFTMILGCFGFMLGTGGCALVSVKLGEQNLKKANSIFSMLTYTAIISGVILAIGGIIFIEPIAVLMGADSNMLPYCLIYGRILLAATPAFILQTMLQSFFVAAEKPNLGLLITILAGVTNIIFDALLVAIFNYGVVGAAIATSLSQCVGGFIPLIYFSVRNSSLLRLSKTAFDVKALFQSCTNGLSELVTNISMSLVSMLYNLQLMKLSGESGVAAYGAVMYVAFIFVAIFIGYSIGSSPVVSYHYGAGNYNELKSLFRKSFTIVTISSIFISTVAFLLSSPLAYLFMGKESELTKMTVTAFKYYSFSVLFSGFSIFGSAFFTALNNGVVSATISLLRTLLFQVISVIILPIIFGLDGIWYSLFTAEILAMFITFYFFFTKKKAYNY